MTGGCGRAYGSHPGGWADRGTIRESVRGDLAAASDAAPARDPGVHGRGGRAVAGICGRILRNAAGVGVPGELVELPAATTTLDLNRQLAAASADPDVGGIIVQMPLPSAIPVHGLAGALDPVKDIDGIHPTTPVSWRRASRVIGRHAPRPRSRS